MKNRNVIVGIIVIVLVAGGLWFVISRQNGQKSDLAQREVVINEAVRTLLYLPLYHAEHHGFFEREGVKVKIVTGGTATASFAAMISGEAEFSQADPMYVPIAREKGSDAKVVAQVVARIAVWGVTMDSTVEDMNAETIRGKKIATHPAPMTAYTYTAKLIKDVGLEPDRDVEIISSTPGTEIAPLLSGQADFALTLEPSTSKAVVQGGHVVLSYPKILGDQIFTALMTKQSTITKDGEMVASVVRAYQLALQDIHLNPEKAIETASAFFPSESREVLKEAVGRMVGEKVIPESVLVSEESWDKAIAVRVAAGDLKAPASRSDSCELDLMQ